MLCPQQPRPRSRPALPAPGGQERRGRCRGQSRRGLGTLAPQGLQAVGPGLPSEQWAVTGREPPGRLKGARSPWSDWRSAPGAWEGARAADPREGGASPGHPGRRHPPRPGRDRAALPRPTGPTWVLLSVRELNLHIVVPRNLLDPGTFGTHDGPMEFLGYGALHGHLGFLGQARHAGEAQRRRLTARGQFTFTPRPSSQTPPFLHREPRAPRAMGQRTGMGQGRRGAWRESPQEGYKVLKAHLCKTAPGPAPAQNSNLAMRISLRRSTLPSQSWRGGWGGTSVPGEGPWGAVALTPQGAIGLR